MQSSISAVEVFIANTTKLFFPQKDSLLKRYKMRSTQHKNLIISTLCLIPCLSTQVLANESVVTTPTTDAAAPVIVAPPVTAVALTEIGSIIAAKQHPYLTLSDFTNRAEDLDALYKTTEYQPIWLGDDNKARKNAADIIKLLADAPAYGLTAENYDPQLLQQKLDALKPPLDVKSKDLALYDTALSLSLLRFMHDLHYGRINPKNLHLFIQLRTESPLDLPALIKTSLAQDTVAQLPSLVEPKLPQYQKLKQALAAYRAAEKLQPFNLVSKASISAGNPLPQSVELQQFLSALGDLPADKVDNSALVYTDTMVDGVKKFQQQNGIKANGVINKATVAAINEPLSQRITQIELAIERLRWLPEITEGPAIMVNIPAFQLSAFDDIKQDSPTTTMRVVVGKAVKHQTPVLTADMQFVDFQPYWNVPYKIAKDEILPKLAMDPDYLLRQNMEFVSSSGNSALRIRQRPGKGNALGKVKFIFPNKSDVYLHDTPSVSLFSRSRRDLSHGCVRVAHPQELAEFVLKNEGNWDTSSIKKAMNGKNRRVTLKNTIPVFFLYNTSFFDENNNLSFYADIYHRDAELLTALKKQEDLSDKLLFAPKEVLPPDEPIVEQIEAATPQTDPVIAKVQPVISTENKSVSIPAIDTTLSP